MFTLVNYQMGRGFYLGYGPHLNLLFMMRLLPPIEVTVLVCWYSWAQKCLLKKHLHVLPVAFSSPSPLFNPLHTNTTHLHGPPPTSKYLSAYF